MVCLVEGLVLTHEAAGTKNWWEGIESSDGGREGGILRKDEGKQRDVRRNM